MRTIGVVTLEVYSEDKIFVTARGYGELKSRWEFPEGGILLKQKKDEVSIRSSAAEYLTYVASAGDQQDSICLLYTSPSPRD